ncbi:VWA domain-containing protein [Homoserinimonas sp. OAct 916]|uniref:vWA domain-containing protein n=1 Tax=Homoserinimonas sp. OAct 916 TaxID=2211450 RepID=UPI000DBE31E0|nr:VWA domain-containing protein [Homoserinimonas sp. OAct 916]
MAEIRSRFHRYEGGDPLAGPVEIAEALDAIGESVMAGSSPERALNEFLRRGGRGQSGLDDLARRVAKRRRMLLRRHNLDGTLEQARQLLEHAVLEERKQLARDTEMDDDLREFAQLRLDSLPPSTAAAVQELSDYAWQSRQARADYEKIKDLLGRELLDQRFAGLKKALENATDEDRVAINQMLGDLNALLEKHRLGEDTPHDFDDFMDKHGDYFPEHPQNIDELIDALAQRAAAAQRMLNSMTTEQREELMQLSAQAFGTPQLMSTLTQLDANLRALRPGENWGGSESFGGDEPLGLGDGTGVLQDIAELDELTEQLSQSHRDARMEDVDLDSLSRQLGGDAAVAANTLRELEKALRETGTLRRDWSGKLTLTPKAMRQLGRSLLRDIATRMSGRTGQRELRQSGAAGEISGATRAWEFGDTEPWDIPRTLLNSFQRRAGGGNGPLIAVDDIEIAETEARTQAAVALLVDTSFSMEMDGRWVPMKRTALALHTLIRSRFRGDHLQLIGFARFAQVMEIEQITALEAEWDKGTNLHHALLLANRHFRNHPDSQPVLLIVTDGEPTSHLEAGGEASFSYPPHPLTIAHTLHELDNSKRLGAQTTFFRLGDDPGLARFMDTIARRVSGRVIAPELDGLDATVVESYLGSRGPTSERGTDDAGGDWFAGRGFWVGG